MRGLTVTALVLALLAAPGALDARPPPDRPPPHPQAPGEQPPAPKPKPPKPNDPEPGGRKAKDAPWVQQADTACRDALQERRDALAKIEKRPPASARQTLLTILREIVRVEAALLARLGRIEPARSDRSRFAQAIALFRVRLAQDAALVAELGRRWDARSLDRQLDRDRATNARLASLWSTLGPKGCAQYFLLATGRG